jgi:hypothetical protein
MNPKEFDKNLYLLIKSSLTTYSNLLNVPPRESKEAIPSFSRLIANHVEALIISHKKIK